MRCRWDELRGTTLSLPHIHQLLDREVARLGDAEPRDHAKWPVIGTDLWPDYHVAETWQGEVDSLRDWIDQRVAWLDAHLPGDCP